MYTDSGKFLNDLGDYNNCLYYKDQYTYFTFTVLNILTRTYQNIGLCIPNQCAEEVASNVYAPVVMGKLNSVFQNATNSTLQPFLNAEFYNPLEEKPQMDWSNYMTIGLIGTLIVLGILGSVFSLTSDSQSKGIKVIKCFSFYDNLTKIVSIPKAHEN
jgi:hypothetical protein